MMTEVEFEDIKLLADQWEIPIATAAYGVFAEGLCKVRGGRGRPVSPENLVLAAARCLAQHDGSMQSTKFSQGTKPTAG